jgi:hypothetical protein
MKTIQVTADMVAEYFLRELISRIGLDQQAVLETNKLPDELHRAIKRFLAALSDRASVGLKERFCAHMPIRLCGARCLAVFDELDGGGYKVRITRPAPTPDEVQEFHTAAHV